MSWRAQAACHGQDSDLWFSNDPEQQALAIDICALCPVREPCREEAIDRGEIYGIWGGLTPKERRRRGMVPHGTTTAYTRHRCRCDRCREAMRVNKADNRRPLEGAMA